MIRPFGNHGETDDNYNEEKNNINRGADNITQRIGIIKILRELYLNSLLTLTKIVKCNILPTLN